MIKISIVDDDEAFVIHMKNKVEKYCKVTQTACQIRTFSKPQLFYYELDEKMHYDICFLDIEMPEINGIKLAEKLREYDKNTYIVFTTSYLSLIHI